MKKKEELMYNEVFFRENKHIKCLLIAKLTRFNCELIWRDFEYQILNANFSSYQEAEDFTTYLNFFTAKHFTPDYLLASADEISNRIIDYTLNAEKIKEEIWEEFCIPYVVTEDHNFYVSSMPLLCSFLKVGGFVLAEILETIAEYTQNNISREECELRINQLCEPFGDPVIKISLRNATNILIQFFWEAYESFFEDDSTDEDFQLNSD